MAHTEIGSLLTDPRTPGRFVGLGPLLFLQGSSHESHSIRKLLSTSRPCSQTECHLGRESGQPPEIGPASAHRRRPGAACLRRRGPDRRRLERRHGTERRGNLDLAPSDLDRTLGKLVARLGIQARFLAGVAVVDDRGDLLDPSALKVVEWAIPLISVTVVLAGSVAIMEHQLYLGATAEQRAKDLERKFAHLQRLLNAMQTKLRSVQSELNRSTQQGK